MSAMARFLLPLDTLYLCTVKPLDRLMIARQQIIKKKRTIEAQTYAWTVVNVQ